jgi:ABC-type oligopeptide transport system substrate-binding subunit
MAHQQNGRHIVVLTFGLLLAAGCSSSPSSSSNEETVVARNCTEPENPTPKEPDITRDTDALRAKAQGLVAAHPNHSTRARSATDTLNGVKMDGAQSYPAFQLKINELLK